MKRDMELVRMILLEMEKQPTFQSTPNLDFSGYTQEEVNYHIMLMNEAGLIIASNVSGFSDSEWIPERITWQGYEFLEASKNNEAWNKTKEIMNKAGGFVFEVAQAVLIKIITQQLTGSL